MRKGIIYHKDILELINEDYNDNPLFEYIQSFNNKDLMDDDEEEDSDFVEPNDDFDYENLRGKA